MQDTSNWLLSNLYIAKICQYVLSTLNATHDYSGCPPLVAAVNCVMKEKVDA